jgi:broad specificity phosphatase PhoE
VLRLAAQSVTFIYLVQHGEKQPTPGDPGLTERGRAHANLTGRWLRKADLGALYSSPLRRARETAQFIATATGLPVQPDIRLRERMNWQGAQPIEAFLAEWAHAERDRDFAPRNGGSSRQAGERLRAFVVDMAAAPATVVAVTHGGVTLDLLRTLLGDRALPANLLEKGVPSCAITTLDGLQVVEVASTAHLAANLDRPHA